MIYFRDLFVTSDNILVGISLIIRVTILVKLLVLISKLELLLFLLLRSFRIVELRNLVNWWAHLWSIRCECLKFFVSSEKRRWQIIILRRVTWCLEVFIRFNNLFFLIIEATKHLRIFGIYRLDCLILRRRSALSIF